MNNEYNNYNNMNNGMDNNYQNMYNQPTGGYPPVQNQNMMNGYNMGMPQNNYNNQINPTYPTSNSNNKSLIITICVVLALIVGYVIYTNSGSGDKVVGGTWNCTGTGTMKFEFKKNKTFKIHNEGINNNYIKGKYTKESTTGANLYHLTATETYMNGKKNTNPGISQTYRISVSEDGKSAAIVSTDYKEDYKCTK